MYNFTHLLAMDFAKLMLTIISFSSLDDIYIQVQSLNHGIYFLIARMIYLVFSSIALLHLFWKSTYAAGPHLRSSFWAHRWSKCSILRKIIIYGGIDWPSRSSIRFCKWAKTLSIHAIMHNATKPFYHCLNSLQCRLDGHVAEINSQDAVKQDGLIWQSLHHR